MEEVSYSNKKSFLLLGSCLFLGILFDILFYKESPGVSYPIFWITLYSVFFLLFRDKWKMEKSFEWFLMILNVLLIFTFLFYSNQGFLKLNLLIVPILFIVQTIILTKNNQKDWYRASFVGEVLMKLVESIPNAAMPFRLIYQLLRKNGNKSNTYGIVGKIVLGLICSIPFIVIILRLLTSADQIFNNWIGEIQKWIGNIDLGNIPSHILLILIVFFLLFIYFWSLLYPIPNEEVPLTTVHQKPFRIDGIISLTILLMIDLVYILFTTIQVSYIFGKAKLLLPDGVTYAQYATAGFYQLVIVAMINILIVIISIHFVQKAQLVIFRTVQILLSLLTACTGFILYSAFLRLSLYEHVYGYTYIRVLVFAFMLLLSMLLLVALIKAWKNELSLIKSYTVIILLWYVILNYVNIDHIIAAQNVARFYQNKYISHFMTSEQGRYDGTDYVDVSYLSQLSYAAVPQLIELRKEQLLKPIVDPILKNMKHKLEQEQDWQSFNFSKYRALQLLKSIK